MARFNPSRHYTSSAPVAWVRSKVFKIEKPLALPWGGWDDWDAELRAKRPIAYFLTEVFPVWLEVIPNYTTKYYTDLRVYVLNIRNHTHHLDSTLEKGVYHDFSERMLYSLFDSFVEYIEVDEAYSSITWYDESSQKKYKVPFRMRHPVLNWGRAWRCPEAGIDHMKWEMEQGLGDGTDIGADRQMASAYEKMALYTWWKVIRPARGESWEASGFRAFWNKMDAKYGNEMETKKLSKHRSSRGWLGLSGKSCMTAAEKATYKKLSEAKDKLEDDWEDEDTEMMIRLIKLRKQLWT